MSCYEKLCTLNNKIEWNWFIFVTYSTASCKDSHTGISKQDNRSSVDITKQGSCCEYSFQRL